MSAGSSEDEEEQLMEEAGFQEYQVKMQLSF